MTSEERASQLISEADGILAHADSGEAFHMTAQRKAVEISDFLGQYGAALDASAGGQSSLVTALGDRVDALAKGVALTESAAEKSPTWAGTKEFFNASGSNFSTFFNNLAPAAKWAVGGLALVLAIKLASLLRR